MSQVYLCIPSARPGGGTLSAWKEQGYKIAVWRDPGPSAHLPLADIIMIAPYPGYARAVNHLAREVFTRDEECEWIVAGGDDTLPDLAHSPDEIAEQCTHNFGDTFGIMQPTGDRWGDDAYGRAHWPEAPAMIDRIAGSPWIGREFARRMYGGLGPYWPGWHHNWLDEELKCVAEKSGVYWARRDLIHYHDHPVRKGLGWPAHLADASAEYKRMEPKFRERKGAGFPGHEPIT
jgi:hypothetical protein